MTNFITTFVLFGAHNTRRRFRFGLCYWSRLQCSAHHIAKRASCEWKLSKTTENLERAEYFEFFCFQSVSRIFAKNWLWHKKCDSIYIKGVENSFFWQRFWLFLLELESNLYWLSRFCLCKYICSTWSINTRQKCLSQINSTTATLVTES